MHRSLPRLTGRYVAQTQCAMKIKNSWLQEISFQPILDLYPSTLSLPRHVILEYFEPRLLARGRFGLCALRHHCTINLLRFNRSASIMSLDVALQTHVKNMVQERQGCPAIHLHNINRVMVCHASAKTGIQTPIISSTLRLTDLPCLRQS
jgi:hypothetical protein